MRTRVEGKVELTFPKKNKTIPPPSKERLVILSQYCVFILLYLVTVHLGTCLQLQWLLSEFLLAIFQTDQQHKLEAFFGWKKEGSGEKGRKWVVVIRFGTH